MQFQYTALTSDAKKTTGVLEALTLEAAKEELHKMELSIISVNPISEEEYRALREKEETTKKEGGIVTFQFEGADGNGKEVAGTIDSADDYSAYKRLTAEFHFSLKNIYKTGAKPGEIEEARNKLPLFADQARAEGFAIAPSKTLTTAQELATGSAAVDEKVIAEIDRIIINGKKLLMTHSAFFSAGLISEIEKSLGELERVRSSNNLKHIEEISSQLYELMSHPDQLPQNETETETDRAYNKLIREISGSAVVRSHAEIATDAKGFLARLNKRLISLTEPKKAAAGAVVKESAIKLAVNRLLKKMTTKAPPRFTPAKTVAVSKKTGFGTLLNALNGYISAPNPILRKIRKQELVQAWKQFLKGEVVAGAAGAGKFNQALIDDVQKLASRAKRKSDFFGFFGEIDSFTAWLLTFYVLYFFLVDFSLEKGIGLPREFVLKTLSGPLLINISIFLLLMHFVLKIKNAFFRQNFLGSAALFVFTLTFYSVLISNF